MTAASQQGVDAGTELSMNENENQSENPKKVYNKGRLHHLPRSGPAQAWQSTLHI